MSKQEFMATIQDQHRQSEVDPVHLGSAVYTQNRNLVKQGSGVNES